LVLFGIFLVVGCLYKKILKLNKDEIKEIKEFNIKNYDN